MTKKELQHVHKQVGECLSEMKCCIDMLKALQSLSTVPTFVSEGLDESMEYLMDSSTALCHVYVGLAHTVY